MARHHGSPSQPNPIEAVSRAQKRVREVTTNEEYFLRESLAHARSLSREQERAYLQGLVSACGEIELPAELRTLLISFIEVDAQLELIASDQLKFRELLKS